MSSPRTDRTNLTFHGVGEPPRTLHGKEPEVWLSVARFESVLDMVVGRQDVLLTFDDANASDLEVALPALRERDLEAIFFLVADRLDQPGFLSTRDARALAEAGMEIGCHGMRHRPWRHLNDAELSEELVSARELLAEATGAVIAKASCPFGAYDRRVLASLHRAGYVQAFTSDGGRSRPEALLQPRTSVGRRTREEDVAALLDGREPWNSRLLRAAKRTWKRWR